MKSKIKICIVRSQYNDTSELLKSAVKELTKRKIVFKILEVPGAFEIPVVIARNIKKYDGFVAIGSIIKGETPNFNFISSAITNGLIQISILYKKPIGNSILTCLNTNQSKERSVKGFEAVIAVCDVLNAK
jgi:6,7-dimethyl-8-ribityllumazine synthase